MALDLRTSEPEKCPLANLPMQGLNSEVPVLNPGYNPFSSLLGPEAHCGPMGVKP
jgi:hypothetical protein